MSFAFDLSHYRILMNGELIPPPDFPAWFYWFQDFDKRCVAETFVGEVHISTVCLGIDHGYGGESLWFETMIFGGEHDQYQERYETLEQAMWGHERALALVKEKSS